MPFSQQTAHVAADQGTSIQIGGFGTVVKVPDERTNGSVAIVEHTLAPGLLGAPPHRHTREDETSYVLEGQLTVQIGADVVTAGPGEIVVKPRGISHTFWNAGDQPVRFLEVISPGGFEDYFAELASIIPADGPPDAGAIAALGARYGMEFDFSSMSELMQRHQVRLAEAHRGGGYALAPHPGGGDRDRSHAGLAGLHTRDATSGGPAAHRYGAGRCGLRC